jgi:hypothetical protein
VDGVQFQQRPGSTGGRLLDPLGWLHSPACICVPTRWRNRPASALRVKVLRRSRPVGSVYLAFHLVPRATFLIRLPRRRANNREVAVSGPGGRQHG